MPKWWQPSGCEDIGNKPWINQAAIDFLESIVSKDSRVCEFGGGGSTVWFSSRCASVETSEPKYEWFKKLAELKLQNAVIYFDNRPNNGNFHIVFIDGEPVEQRADWLKFARNITLEDGWIVLDNANRPEYAEQRKYMIDIAAEVKTFDGNEQGTRYLVTEFYRMK